MPTSLPWLEAQHPTHVGCVSTSATQPLLPAVHRDIPIDHVPSGAKCRMVVGLLAEPACGLLVRTVPVDGPPCSGSSVHSTSESGSASRATDN